MANHPRRKGNPMANKAIFPTQNGQPDLIPTIVDR